MFSRYLAQIQVGHTRQLKKRFALGSPLELGVFTTLLLIVAIVLVMVIILADADGASNEGLYVWLAADLAVYIVLILYSLQLREYKKRPLALQKFAEQNGLVYVPVPLKLEIEPFRNIGLLQIHNVREPEFTNILKAEDWIYGELAYKIYRRTKRGDVHTETAYYSVISMELPRELPNIFFDSKRARGRQFRFEFDNSQLHTLEGDFNKYFATYFPADYSIDGLSIVTPDVMQALISAADYDIETVSNRVNLYGPIYAVDRQLPDMAAKLRVIHKQLLDNILTYRDERLPYAIGRQSVAPAGASLKRSKFWKYATIIGVVIYILLKIIEVWASSYT